MSGEEKICFQPPVARLELLEKFSRGMASICFLWRTKPRGAGAGVPIEPMIVDVDLGTFVNVVG